MCENEKQGTAYVSIEDLQIAEMKKVFSVIDHDQQIHDDAGYFSVVGLIETTSSTGVISEGLVMSFPTASQNSRIGMMVYFDIFSKCLSRDEIWEKPGVAENCNRQILRDSQNKNTMEQERIANVLEKFGTREPERMKKLVSLIIKKSESARQDRDEDMESMYVSLLTVFPTVSSLYSDIDFFLKIAKKMFPSIKDQEDEGWRKRGKKAFWESFRASPLWRNNSEIKEQLFTISVQKGFYNNMFR